MKKLFFFLAAGAFALSACTSEAEIDVGPLSNAIGFENAVLKQTRADEAVKGDLDNDHFDKFLVYGYYTVKNQTSNPIQVFSGEPVTRTFTEKDGKMEPSPWTYVNTRFWVPDATYHFFAYSCADIALANTYGTIGLSLNVVDNDREMTISKYICDQSHNHDLIVAQSRNNPSVAMTPDNPTPNGNVSLKFEHVLTKIDAQFTSEFAGEYDVVIDDVKILNFRNIGDFTSNAKIWTAERSAPNVSIQLPFSTGKKGVANAVELNEDGTVKRAEKKATTGSVYMLPVEYKTGDVIQLQFTLEVYRAGDDHTQANQILGRTMTGTWSPNWEVGKYYTYNVKLTGTAANLQPIVFETATDMNDWIPGSSTNTNISFSAN